MAAATCHLVRSERRRTMTLLAAAVGVLLAMGGMYEMLIPFLVLLGSVIPPIGGVIMADFWFRHRGKYPALASVQLPRYNLAGLTAYAVGALLAYLSPWIAPLVGIGASAIVYIVLLKLSRQPAVLPTVQEPL